MRYLSVLCFDADDIDCNIIVNISYLNMLHHILVELHVLDYEHGRKNYFI